MNYPLSTYFETVNNAVTEALIIAQGQYYVKPVRKEGKLIENAKSLLRNIKTRDGSKKAEPKSLNMQVSEAICDDQRKYNTDKIEEVIEENGNI